MTSTEHEPDHEGPDTPDPDTGAETKTETKTDGAPLTEDDYALGSTSDPDGASSSEPAGEDYAGSGF